MLVSAAAVGGRGTKESVTKQTSRKKHSQPASAPLHKRIAAGNDGWMDGDGFEVEGVQIRCSARRWSIEGKKRDGQKAVLVQTSEAQREDADDGMRRPQL